MQEKSRLDALSKPFSGRLRTAIDENDMLPFAWEPSDSSSKPENSSLSNIILITYCTQLVLKWMKSISRSEAGNLELNASQLSRFRLLSISKSAILRSICVHTRGVSSFGTH